MQVYIVSIKEHFVLIEYTDKDKLLQRKYVPRQVLQTDIQRIYAEVPDAILDYGIEYSDVELTTALSHYLSDIQLRNLEQAMRKKGLWLREDYRTNANLVTRVLQEEKFMGKVDTSLVLNAALVNMEV